MRLVGLCAVSLITIILVGSVFGGGLTTYLIDFEDGVHLPVWVSIGKNTTTVKAWSGNALKTESDNSYAAIQIYNFGEDGKKIFEYSDVKKLYYEFWIAGTGEFTAHIKLIVGSVRENEYVSNNFTVLMTGVAYGEYSQLKITKLGILWGKSDGTPSYETLFESTGGAFAKSKFTMDINLLHYPDSITFTFTYFTDEGIRETSRSIDNPNPVGVFTTYPETGDKSAFSIHAYFSEHDDSNIGIIVDNINIDYEKEMVVQEQPITVYMVGATMVVIPVAVYFAYKRKAE